MTNKGSFRTSKNPGLPARHSEP